MNRESQIFAVEEVTILLNSIFHLSVNSDNE